MTARALLTPLYLASLKPRDREFTVGDVQCPGLCLRVQPGGTRAWVFSRRIDGKARRITLGTWPDLSPEAARAAFHARLAALTPPASPSARGAAARQGPLPRPAGHRAPTPTFADVAAP